MTPDLTQALAAVEKMIYAYAHWWQQRNPEMDLEDLAQEGRLGFCRAFERWRPEAGAKLSSFATPYIRQAMRKWVQRTRDTIRSKTGNFLDRVDTLSLDQPWGQDDTEDTLADCLAAPEPEDTLANQADLRELVAAAVEDLPPKKRAVVKARFIAGRTFEDIGRDFNVSREAVRKLCLVAVDELKNHPTLKAAA